jgi:hypothetical protein
LSLDLTSWSRVQHADGGVTLTAPAPHPAFARHRRAQLRLRHDVPLATLDDVIAAEPRYRIERAEPTERVLTRSGEYGAFRHLHVRARDEQLSWAVGLVAAGDRMTVVEGLARSPNIAELVRDVLDGSVPSTAHDRIRMVPYRPPPGWFGVRRTLATVWLAPGAPRDPATLVVGDAVPRGPAERTHALMWPLEVPDGAARDGELATWTVDGRVWAVAQRGDTRWSIRAALRAGDASHLVTLRELVASIELPSPPPSPAPDVDVYAWMAM